MSTPVKKYKTSAPTYIKNTHRKSLSMSGNAPNSKINMCSILIFLNATILYNLAPKIDQGKMYIINQPNVKKHDHIPQRRMFEYMDGTDEWGWKKWAPDFVQLHRQGDALMRDFCDQKTTTTAAGAGMVAVAADYFAESGVGCDSYYCGRETCRLVDKYSAGEKIYFLRFSEENMKWKRPKRSPEFLQ